MKACENVIVSVAMRQGDKNLDMELPAFMPAEELGAKLLETLRVMSPATYSAVTKLGIRHSGKMLASADTLASCGAWDGAILEITFEREA